MPVISLQELKTQKKGIVSLSELRGARPEVLTKEEAPDFIPDVERKISERRDILPTALPQLKRGFLSQEKGSGRELLKGAIGTVGGVFQRAEATVAAPILALRKGEGIQEAGREAIRGLKGERLVERGDIARSFGIPEPVAATLGFITDPLILKSFFGKSAASFTRKALMQTDDLIDDAFTKAIKPSIRGKGTLSQIVKAKAKTREAVRTIVANKKNLEKLPESLDDFSRAIQQTKKNLFDDAINPALQNTGQAGVKVETNNVIKALDDVINSESLKVANPRVIRYAKNMKARFFEQPVERPRILGPTGRELFKKEAPKLKELTPQRANDIIQELNQNLASFYKSPLASDPTIVKNLAVDAGVANTLRKSLDISVKKATGVAFQELKNKYGALRSIEDAVNKALARDANRSIKGLIDFSDILSGGNIVSGVLRANPATIAAGLTQKAVASFIKRVNNPNKIISKMFQNIERLSAAPSVLRRTRLGISGARAPAAAIGIKEQQKERRVLPLNTLR